MNSKTIIKAGDFVKILNPHGDLENATNGSIRKGSIVKVLEVDSNGYIYILDGINREGTTSPSGKSSWQIPRGGYEKVESQQSQQKTKEEYIKEGYKIKS